MDDISQAKEIINKVTDMMEELDIIMCRLRIEKWRDNKDIGE